MQLYNGDCLEVMKSIPDKSISTGIACINTNRNFIGIELDKQYFDIAKERLTSYKKCND